MITHETNKTQQKKENNTKETNTNIIETIQNMIIRLDIKAPSKSNKLF